MIDYLITLVSEQVMRVSCAMGIHMFFVQIKQLWISKYIEKKGSIYAKY